MAYLWVVFALISAFTLATSDALTKKALKGNIGTLPMFLDIVLDSLVKPENDERVQEKHCKHNQPCDILELEKGQG